MANSTIALLSAIAGVTVYASKAAALSGAVDSGAALNAYIAALSVPPLRGVYNLLEWDGYIYVADQIVYCPSGGQIWHRRKEGTASAGAAFGEIATAKPRMINANPVSSLVAIIDKDITFQDLNGDFGFTTESGSTQPHDDETYGWAFGFVGAGVKNLTITGCTFENSRTFCGYLIAVSGVSIKDSDFLVDVTADAFNLDGLHINGPAEYIEINGVTVQSQDDGFAFNAMEPNGGGNDQNYRAASYMQSWTGGPIRHVRITNCVLDNCLYGVRPLTLSSDNPVEDVVVDGLTGTVHGYIFNADPYDEDNTGGVPDQGESYISDITLRNIDVQASGAFNSYKPGRFYIHSHATNLTIDFATITPVSADGTDVPLIHIHPRTILTNFSPGGVAGTAFTDDFARSDGAVGNGWTGSGYAISGGKLVATGDGAGHNLVRPSGEAFVDGQWELSYTAATASEIAATIGRYADDSNFLAAANIDRSSNRFYALTVHTGDVAVLDPLDTTYTDAVSYRLRAWTRGGILVARREKADGTATERSVCVPGGLAVTASGKSGISAYAPSGTITIDDFLARPYTDAPALTAITVTQTGTDDDGNILFSATPTPATAVSDGGEWATDVGFINFGRLYGVPAGQTATVTYTYSAVTGTATYTAPNDSLPIDLLPGTANILRPLAVAIRANALGRARPGFGIGRGMRGRR